MVNITGYDVRTLTASGVADVALSVDKKSIYAAMQNGTIVHYDIATGAVLSTWKVGTKLGSISLSQDGSYLLVVEAQPPSGQSVLYKMETGSGTSQILSLAGGADSILDIRR